MPDLAGRHPEGIRAGRGDIDLLVCGAGSKHGLLFTWLKDHAKIALPSGAIGDLCLIPISHQGDEVPLDHNGPAHMRKFLNPRPAYTELRALAARDRIIFVAMDYQRRSPARPKIPDKPDSNGPTHPVPCNLPSTLPVPHPPLPRTQSSSSIN